MIKTLTQHETEKIRKQLNEQFGISEIPGKIIAWGKDRLFLFTGEAGDKELEKIQHSAPIEKIGVYFAKIINDEIKLTIEGTQALSSQITKGIFNLDSRQAEEWMMGRELNIKTGLKGFIAIKHKDDFLGCGKASQEKITNFIPKPRRLKNRQ